MKRFLGKFSQTDWTNWLTSPQSQLLAWSTRAVSIIFPAIKRHMRVAMFGPCVWRRTRRIWIGQIVRCGNTARLYIVLVKWAELFFSKREYLKSAETYVKQKQVPKIFV